jgi:hypothetical protein
MDGNGDADFLPRMARMDTDDGERAKQHPPLSVKIRVIRGRWIEAVLFAHIGVHPR